jgi:hypothetical protein
VVQGVHTKHKECVDGICFISKAQKIYHKNFPLPGVKSECCKVCTVICRRSNLRKNLVQTVHREKGECQEGERNLSSINNLDLSYLNP